MPRRLIVALFLLAGSVAAQPTLAGAPSHFATLDGNKVHYKTLGQGNDVVVFVHGWCSNLNFWSDNAPALAGKLRVIALDLPGHGLSDKPQITYTMDLFARAI